MSSINRGGQYKPKYSDQIEARTAKDEDTTHPHLLPYSDASTSRSRGHSCSDLQADRAECVCERDHNLKSAIGPLLQQDQRAEALPLSVPQEPEPQEVC